MYVRWTIFCFTAFRLYWSLDQWSEQCRLLTKGKSICVFLCVFALVCLYVHKHIFIVPSIMVVCTRMGLRAQVSSSVPHSILQRQEQWAEVGRPRVLVLTHHHAYGQPWASHLKESKVQCNHQVNNTLNFELWSWILKRCCILPQVATNLEPDILILCSTIIIGP